MRNLYLSLTIIECCVLAGCGTSQPVTRDILVGTYEYKSEDPEDRPTDHTLDRLILKADGKYNFIQGGSTKAKVETTGGWTLFKGRDAMHFVLDLDHSGYPVEVNGKEVRLLVDNDTGIRYQKVQ